jgi:hypothetical protein
MFNFQQQEEVFVDNPSKFDGLWNVDSFVDVDTDGVVFDVSERRKHQEAEEESRKEGGRSSPPSGFNSHRCQEGA